MSQESYEKLDLLLGPAFPMRASSPEEKTAFTPPAVISSQTTAPAPVASATRRAVPRPPREARPSFLARAREDHAVCGHIVRSLTLFKESRRKIPTLLQRSIQEAERLGHDDGLYSTYIAISQMMEEWWWVDNLRATINNTLTALAENALARRPSATAQLAEKVNRLTQEVADRDATIETFRASDVQHAKRYQEIKKRADEQAITIKENKRSIADLEGKLNEALTKIDAIIHQQSQQSTPETPSQKAYDPRMMGRRRSC